MISMKKSHELLGRNGNNSYFKTDMLSAKPNKLSAHPPHQPPWLRRPLLPPTIGFKSIRNK